MLMRFVYLILIISMIGYSQSQSQWTLNQSPIPISPAAQIFDNAFFNYTIYTLVGKYNNITNDVLQTQFNESDLIST